MLGARPRASCRGLFKKLEILPVPCQYILSVMLFMIDNSNKFLTSSEVHGFHTRSKNHVKQTYHFGNIVFMKKNYYSGCLSNTV